MVRKWLLSKINNVQYSTDNHPYPVCNLFASVIFQNYVTAKTIYTFYVTCMYLDYCTCCILVKHDNL